MFEMFNIYVVFQICVTIIIIIIIIIIIKKRNHIVESTNSN